MRGLQDRGRDRARATRARSTASRSTASTRRTGSSASRRSRSRSSELYAERPDFVAPRTRYNEALAFINGGLQDVSLSRAKLTWGVEVPWDPDHVFYVWFDALLNYYTALSLRPRRRGPDRPLLAGDLPHPRQGHPQVPRRLLAGDADGRRPPGARARADPRLPADARRVGRGDEDVQVARQRARPVRGDGHVRHRRAALLLLPRGLLRPGRRRLDDHVRRALRVRAGQRLRQPREPHAGDDRPLPRRRRARRRRRPGARARLRRPRRRGLRAARPRRDHPGARAHLAARAPAQPLRRGARALAARQGRARRRPSSTSTLRSLAEGIRAVTVLLHPYMPGDGGEAARRARGGASSRWSRRGVRRPPRRRHASASSPPLFPKPQ